MENNIPTTCPMCQSPIKEKKGISQKTGKPYQFYGCSNYPNCRYIWNPPKKGTKQTPLREYDQGQTIIAMLKRIETKLDELSNKSVIYPNDSRYPNQ